MDLSKDSLEGTAYTATLIAFSMSHVGNTHTHTHTHTHAHKHARTRSRAHRERENERDAHTHKDAHTQHTLLLCHFHGLEQGLPGGDGVHSHVDRLLDEPCMELSNGLLVRLRRARGHGNVRPLNDVLDDQLDEL